MRIRWTLAKENEAAVMCVVRPLLDGVDVRITYNGLLIAGRVCPDEPDALMWAEHIRLEWLARGWTESSPSEFLAEQLGAA